jgi:hypothetical protein
LEEGQRVARGAYDSTELALLRADLEGLCTNEWVAREDGFQDEVVCCTVEVNEKSPSRVQDLVPRLLEHTPPPAWSENVLHASDAALFLRRIPGNWSGSEPIFTAKPHIDDFCKTKSDCWTVSLYISEGSLTFPNLPSHDQEVVHHPGDIISWGPVVHHTGEVDPTDDTKLAVMLGVSYENRGGATAEAMTGPPWAFGCPPRRVQQ